MPNGKNMILHSIVGLIKKLMYKNVTHVDVSNLALKSNLASLKSEVDK